MQDGETMQRAVWMIASKNKVKTHDGRCVWWTTHFKYDRKILEKVWLLNLNTCDFIFYSDNHNNFGNVHFTDHWSMWSLFQMTAPSTWRPSQMKDFQTFLEEDIQLCPRSQAPPAPQPSSTNVRTWAASLFETLCRRGRVVQEWEAIWQTRTSIPTSASRNTATMKH